MTRRRPARAAEDRLLSLAVLRLAEGTRLTSEAEATPDRSPAAIVRRAVLLIVDAQEAGDVELADALERFAAEQLDRHIAGIREEASRVRP